MAIYTQISRLPTSFKDIYSILYRYLEPMWKEICHESFIEIIIVCILAAESRMKFAQYYNNRLNILFDINNMLSRLKILKTIFGSWIMIHLFGWELLKIKFTRVQPNHHRSSGSAKRLIQMLDRLIGWDLGLDRPIYYIRLRHHVWPKR